MLDGRYQFPEPQALKKDIRHYLDYDVNFELNALSENEKKLFFQKDGQLCVREATKLGYKIVEKDGKKTKVRVNKKTGAEVDKKKKK